MYRLTDSYKDKTAEGLWTLIITGLEGKNIVVKSIAGKEYRIITVKEDGIKYQSPDRNNGAPESIRKKDVIDFLNVLLAEEEFHTKSITESIPRSIYRKRSPVFAILLHTKIIEKKIDS